MAYADTLTNLQKANTIQPTLGTFDESKGVAGRVESITGSASPLMATARTRAKQRAASSGLMNSSIAAQAGEQAVIETATPIASADANLYQQQNLTNQQASNQAATQNAANALTAGVQGSQLDVSQDQSRRSLMEQARQFDTTTSQRDSQFGVTSAQQQQQIDNQRAQEAARLGENSRQFDASRADNVSMFDRELGEKSRQFGLTQDQQMGLARLDVDTKLKLADIEAKYKNEIQGSANISNAWGTTMQGIASIQTNPNLDEATKATLINNNLASFQAFSSFWNKATGGTTDVTDLLNFTVASQPGAAAGAPAPAPPAPGQPGSGVTVEGDADLNGDGVPDWRESAGGE